MANDDLWWKGIKLGDKMIVWGEGKGKGNTVRFEGMINASLLEENDLVLWKAKFLGEWRPMYKITDAKDKMREGQHYIFTWMKD